MVERILVIQLQSLLNTLKERLAPYIRSNMKQ